MFTSSLQTTTQCLLFAIIILFFSSVVVRANGESGCVDECNTYAADPSSVSRCIKYECRKRVFSYIIRFGKRSDTDEMESEQPRERSNRLHSLLHIFLDRKHFRTLPLDRFQEATPENDALLQHSSYEQEQLPQQQPRQLQQQFFKRDDADSASRALRLRQIMQQRRRKYRLLESLLRFG